jgi:ABC-type siderophore export system fused ATPase/permease subunit
VSIQIIKKSVPTVTKKYIGSLAMINNYTGMEVSLTMAVLPSYHAIVTMVNSSAHVSSLPEH